MDPIIETPQPVIPPPQQPQFSKTRRNIIIAIAGAGVLALLCALYVILMKPPKPTKVGKLVIPIRSEAEVEKLTIAHEKPVVVSGTYVEEHADKFDGTKPVETKFVQDDKGVQYKIQLHDEKQSIEPNSKVTLSGVQSTTDKQNTISVDPAVNKPATNTASLNTPGFAGNNNVVVTQAPPDTVLKPSKLAVVLINFTQDKSTPFTPSDVEHALYDMPRGVDNYFKEASYNQISLVGLKNPHADVYGYYTVDGGDASHCNVYDYAFAARQQAKSNNIDLTRDYDHIMYVITRSDKCLFSALAFVGGTVSYYNGTLLPVTIEHELGHSFSMEHANGLICTDENNTPVSYSTNCSSKEYADRNDVMGSSFVGQFNGYHKAQAGWLGAERIQTILTSGHYSVTPLETRGKGVLARIPIGVDLDGFYTFYYLDYRNPIGYFDNDLLSTKIGGYRPLGLSIYIGKDIFYRYTGTQTINATPSSANFYESDWQAGATFEDKVHNVKIKVDKLDSLSGDFTVTMPSSNPTSTQQTTYTDPANIYSLSYPASFVVGEKLQPTFGEEQIGISYRVLADTNYKDMINASMLHSKKAPQDWYTANAEDSKGPSDNNPVNGYITFHKQGCNATICADDYVLSHNGVLLFIRFNKTLYGKDDRGVPTTDDRSQYISEFQKLIQSVHFK